MTDQQQRKKYEDDLGGKDIQGPQGQVYAEQIGAAVPQHDAGRQILLQQCDRQSPGGTKRRVSARFRERINSRVPAAK